MLYTHLHGHLRILFQSADLMNEHQLHAMFAKKTKRRLQLALNEK